MNHIPPGGIPDGSVPFDKFDAPPGFVTITIIDTGDEGCSGLVPASEFKGLITDIRNGVNEYSMPRLKQFKCAVQAMYNAREYLVGLDGRLLPIVTLTALITHPQKQIRKPILKRLNETVAKRNGAHLIALITDGAVVWMVGKPKELSG